MSVNALKNNRATFIQNSLSKGKSREEVASLLGYKTWRSLDIYMRRTGAKWDSGLNTYVYHQNRAVCDDMERILSEAPPKIAVIISKFSKDNTDPLQIAKECGFRDHRALSTYMKAKGYRWSPEINNYIDTPFNPIQQEPPYIDSPAENNEEASSPALENEKLQKYISFLETLYENKERFLEMASSESSHGSIPRYTVPGITRTKSFYMSDKLSRLVSEFSEAMNISQKEIIEAAVIEFLRSHSFKEEVDSLIGRL